MMTYQEYEESVYNWLVSLNKEDPEFTFSLRRNGTKGAKRDYFIGTEKSKYFGTSFWSIPVGYPGSSGDFFDIFFGIKNGLFTYTFEFGQTTNPNDEQNKAAMDLAEALRISLKSAFDFKTESTPGNKIIGINTKPREESYSDLDEMLKDVMLDIQQFVPIFENEIAQMKKKYPSFVAHRILPSEFEEMHAKMLKRRIKYKEDNPLMIDLSEEKLNQLKRSISKFSTQDVNDFLDACNYILSYFKLNNKDELVYSADVSNRLHLTIGSRYAISIEKISGQTFFGLYVDVPIAESLKEKYPNIENLIDKEGSGSFGNWLRLPFNQVDFDDFKAGVVNVVKKSVGAQEKSQYRSQYEEKHNPWIIEAALDPNVRQKLFDTNEKSVEDIHPINQILYGPPGTGKTFKLKNDYFQKYTSKETSINSERYFQNTVAELHWWEVLALALKELEKAKVTELLQNRWVLEKANQSDSKNVRATLWGTLQQSTVDECQYVKYAKRNKIQIFNKTKDGFWELVEEQVEEQIPELLEKTQLVDNFKANPDKEVKRYVFTTFHQSYAYEDFIEGIKPKLPENEEEIEDLTYVIEPGVFKRLCQDAANDPENKYAIFIDEINRGNVSAIFGELITLIELDKRKGGENPMSAKLPYSKKEFSVPSNIDIYGTMNTADRSVEALDTALRRRFSFVEMMPDYSLLKDLEIEGVNIASLLKLINERIEMLIDRDHQIGHSYFINVSSLKDLTAVFKDKVVPLLQEYFYGDYGKIGLVLGKGFVKKVSSKKVDFADFTDYNDQQSLKQDSFQLVDMNDQEFDLHDALKGLHKKQNPED